MAELSYQYSTITTFEKKGDGSRLILSHQSELDELNSIPCFFWGSLTDPYITARCWMLLSRVVRSTFMPVTPKFKDPIITAGTSRMRFEAFSSDNGVYARLDMNPEAIDGEFIASGTTNVDFNEPMLNAINAIQKNEKVVLSVGQTNMQVITEKSKQIERKVSLPERWIKGLSSVQLYLADMDLRFELNKIQILQLFQTLPKGAVKDDLHIIYRAGKYVFNSVPSKEGVRINGIQRIRLLESVIAFSEKLYIYSSIDQSSAAFVCEFGSMQLLLAFSPEVNRGFSGEGKALENLIQDIPLQYVYGLGSILKTNETFNPSLLSIENDISFGVMDHLTSSLSSMGLLGYDLLAQEHFYRRLPFKMERILSLNPRLKNAKKIIENSKVEIIEKRRNYVEAKVRGTDVWHKVIIDNEKPWCTCRWWSEYEGSRGICKHILAVKIYENTN
ncbi:MAG: SWIM zinc finger family protein [Flavobacteriales bacterium]|jgi:hypothetical protein